MNEKQELLTIFMEECAEASVEAAKLIRFGSPDHSEVHRMEVEVGDVLCMIDLLHEYGIIDKVVVQDHIKSKREKLKQWSNLTKLEQAQQ